MLNCKTIDELAWIIPGAHCYCNGEGTEKFIVCEWVNDEYVLLCTLDGEEHGLESATKLHKPK